MNDNRRGFHPPIIYSLSFIADEIHRICPRDKPTTEVVTLYTAYRTRALDGGKPIFLRLRGAHPRLYPPFEANQGNCASVPTNRQRILSRCRQQSVVHNVTCHQ